MFKPVMESLFMMRFILCVLIFASSFRFAQGQEKLTNSFIVSQSAIFVDWLEACKLSETFEFIRIRRGYHPVETIDEKIYQLQLRMLPQGENKTFELAYLGKFSQAFAQQNGIALHKKLFYKFIHLMQLPPRLASVHIHVYDTDLGIYENKYREIVIDTTWVRSVRESIRIDTVKIHLEEDYLGFTA
jgi:hypothetical protein